jgi:hypothetical protein
MLSFVFHRSELDQYPAVFYSHRKAREPAVSWIDSNTAVHDIELPKMRGAGEYRSFELALVQRRTCVRASVPESSHLTVNVDEQ